MIDIEGNLIRCFGTKGSDDSQLDGLQKVLMWMGKEELLFLKEEMRRVSVFEKDGTFLFSFGKGRMKHPFGVVVDSFGSIIVSDFENKSIEFWN